MPFPILFIGTLIGELFIQLFKKVSLRNLTKMTVGGALFFSGE